MPDNSCQLNIPGLDVTLSLLIHDERDQHVSRRLREEGIWEPYETELLSQLIRPGHVVLDAGANIGYFSVLASHWVGEAGRVFAFEPDPRNFALLKDNLVRNGFDARAQPIQAGLAAAPGKAQLFLSADNFGDHQLHPDDPGRDSVAIDLVKGSDWLAGRCDHVDVLKIDTQGAEYEVIAGLIDFLKQGPPCQVLIELTPFSLRGAGASGRALIELLAELGEPFWIVDHIEHRLVSCGSEELAEWCDNVDACEDDRGFMNILVGPGITD